MDDQGSNRDNGLPLRWDGFLFDTHLWLPEWHETLQGWEFSLDAIRSGHS